MKQNMIYLFYLVENLIASLLNRKYLPNVMGKEKNMMLLLLDTVEETKR